MKNCYKIFLILFVIIALFQINLMAKEFTENNEIKTKITPTDSSWSALREIREEVGAPTGEVLTTSLPDEIDLTKPLPDEPEFQEDPLGRYTGRTSKEENVTSLQNNTGVEQQWKR